jgi:hypothetical protein
LDVFLVFPRRSAFDYVAAEVRTLKQVAPFSLSCQPIAPLTWFFVQSAGRQILARSECIRAAGTSLSQICVTFVPSINQSSNSPRNGVDFHFNSVPQNRLHCGPRRANPRKELRVHPIKTIEILNVCQMTSTLHHILKTISGGLKDFPNV